MVLFSGCLKIKCMPALCQALCSIIKTKKGSQLEYTLNSDCCKISFSTDKAHGEIILISKYYIRGDEYMYFMITYSTYDETRYEDTTIMIETTRGYHAYVEHAMARIH